MQNLRSAALLVALTVSHIPAVMAGAGIITTTVTRLQSNVTYSAAATSSPPAPALDTYIGYAVVVGSDPTNTNTVNNVRFTGATAVNTDPAEKAVFSSSDGVVCNPVGDGTSIDCAIGQLRAGQSVSFAVFFRAPQKTVNGVADDARTDFASFSGTTFYAEGTGGPNSVPQNSTVLWNTLDVELGTTNSTFVKSAVQRSGGSLFTGSGAAATGADTWTTTVAVPATTSYTTAQIQETTDVPLASNLLDRSISTLSIPGSFQKLVITLRRDASTIVKGAKIASAKVYYDNPTTPAAGVVYPYEVLPCTDTTYGSLPKPGIPCINRRTEYTKKTAPTPDWEGDWEFEIFALDNGRYVN